MVAPRLRLEVGYGSTWQTEPGSITWTDETSRVNDRRQLVTMQRGASSARGQIDTGELSLVLNNRDRRFDPTHTTGPLYGQLRPGTPVRVVALVGSDAVDVPIWSGTIPAWPQRYDRGNTWATVPVTAYDRFDKLSRAKIPRSVLESEILADSPVAYWPLGESTGRTMADRSGGGHDGLYDHGTTALSTAAESESGGRFSGLDLDGEHVGTSRDDGFSSTRPCTFVALLAPDTNVAGDYSYPIQGGSGDLRGSYVLAVQETADSSGWKLAGAIADGGSDDVAFSEIQDFDDAYHHVAYRGLSGSPAQMWVDGVDATASNSSTTTVSPASPGVTIGAFKWTAAGPTKPYKGWVAHVALFDSDIGESRLAAHAAAALAPLDGQTTDERTGWILDEIAWPVGFRNLSTGRTRLGPATFKPGDGALEYLRLIEATEDGLLFIGPDGSLVFHDRYWRYLETVATVSQFTFTDQDGDQGYAEFQLDLDDELLVNVARFSRRDGTEQVVSDASSVAIYGEAEEQRSNLLSSTDAQVRSLAEWTVSTRSTPLPRVPSIRIPLHRYSTADQETVLGLDLDRRVTVTRTPQGVGDPITLDFLVEGISHRVGVAEWWVDLFVSPTPQDAADLFLLGSSELGGTHILAH